jgi:hypothetical protein
MRLSSSSNKENRHFILALEENSKVLKNYLRPLFTALQ